MGRAVQNLKVFALALVASFLLLTIFGYWGVLGADGPFEILGAWIGLLFDYPELLGAIVVVVGFIIIADRIAG